MKRSASVRPVDSAEELAAKEARWTALGRHLRELRDGRRWRQERLAEYSGVSVPTIRAIENHQAGRRHTPRTLQKLSRAFGFGDDYLGNYLENPAQHEAGAAKSEPPPRASLDQMALRLDEIIADRLNEIVVPRLESVENQVRNLVDVIHRTGLGVEIYREHPGDAK
jgi:transcriptional regulator with XRE-family HTH domain